MATNESLVPSLHGLHSLFSSYSGSNVSGSNAAKRMVLQSWKSINRRATQNMFAIHTSRIQKRSVASLLEECLLFLPPPVSFLLVSQSCFFALTSVFVHCW